MCLIRSLIYLFEAGAAPQMQVCRPPLSKSVGHSCIVLKTEHFVRIDDISEGKDVFLWLPMGLGK